MDKEKIRERFGFYRDIIWDQEGENRDLRDKIKELEDEIDDLRSQIAEYERREMYGGRYD